METQLNGSSDELIICTKKLMFLGVAFFFIVLCFPPSAYFSLDSPGLGNQITAGKKRNPNWHRYKAHFTYLGHVPHSPLQYITVHHYSNPDPTSDLTYHPKTQTYHNSINPITKKKLMFLIFPGLYFPD
jgi:hypothetical protein